MSKKKKFIAEFNEFTGQSFVIMETEVGTATGHAYLHPDDKDVVSKFQGCRIAEFRAWITYANEKMKLLRIEIKALTDLEKIYISLKDYNKDSLEGRRLRRRIKEKQAELADYRHRKEIAKKSIREMIVLYDKKMQKFKKIKGEFKGEADPVSPLQ